jgi:hypothetical protein
MLNRISSILDAVADSLEAKGFIKEAYEIDKIADILDNSDENKFPIEVKWVPGNIGDWGNFRIKEAASGIITKHNKDLIDMVFKGSSIKRDGTERKWKNVIATGNYFISKDLAVMVEVQEGSEKRHLNIGTFTGTGISKKSKYNFLNGVKSEDKSQYSINKPEDKPKDKISGKPKEIEDGNLSYLCNRLTKNDGKFESASQASVLIDKLNKGEVSKNPYLIPSDVGVIVSPRSTKGDASFISSYILDDYGVRMYILDWWKFEVGMSYSKAKELADEEFNNLSEEDERRYEQSSWTRVDSIKERMDKWVYGGRKIKWKRDADKTASSVSASPIEVTKMNENTYTVSGPIQALVEIAQKAISLLDPKDNRAVDEQYLFGGSSNQYRPLGGIFAVFLEHRYKEGRPTPKLFIQNINAGGNDKYNDLLKEIVDKLKK